jgi:lysine 2,3-aminomutase
MSDRWNKCWAASREIHTLLAESETLESAREKVISYLNTVHWSYRRDLDDVRHWDYVLLREAVRCMSDIISPRSERVAQNSSLEKLWKAAREGDADVSQDFIDEFTHFFRAIKSETGVYPSKLAEGIEEADYSKLRGREAAVRRSDFLEILAGRMNQFLGRYPSGLRAEIAEKRDRNRAQILKVLGATEKEWADWKWHFANVFRNRKGLEAIKKVIRLTPEEEAGMGLAVDNGVPFGVTPHYLSLMDPEPSDLDYAIRRQVFPPVSYVENMIAHKEDKAAAFDFMRERDTSPIDLVTRRYPKVAIMKPYDTCPQICVYCQRNWEITAPFSETALAARERIDNAIDWFAQHENILDVLVTGGDPLVMSDQMLDYILKRFWQIKHIRSVRLATRMPITVPQRFTDELCEIMGRYYEAGKQTLCMVTHFMHPYEVTMDTARVVKKVKMQGLHVYNQSVFTFANSRRFECAALRIAIKQIGVDPYYTFNMKGKSEIADYAVPVARLLQERKEEARLLPGIFRTDEPVFNVPLLGKNHLRAWQDHEMISILPDGRRVYLFHTWEKNITKARPYLYTDVPIRSYLERLAARGEDLTDYKSIWYYY